MDKSLKSSIMGEIIGLVAVIGFWSSVIVITYMYFYTRHKERMSGVVVTPAASPRKFVALRWGLLLIGIGCGLFAGAVLEKALPLPKVFTTVFTTCIGGGLALLFYFKRVENLPESDTV